MLKIKEPLVSVDWLKAHMHSPNLIILDASIKKVTEAQSYDSSEQIPFSRFFDIKNKFSDDSGQFPNTCPSTEQFTKEAQNLGINTESAIVIYDDKGIYSAPRAWWLFKVYGHENVTVLDGGLPAWKQAGFDVVPKNDQAFSKGDFKAHPEMQRMCFFDELLTISKDGDRPILDARSEDRFKGLVPEPRKGLRSGTIPNSQNLPFESLLNSGKMKTKEELRSIFNEFNNKDKAFVLSCGSGITACVLALGASLLGYEDLTVYDGSWTEYGSLMKQ